MGERTTRGILTAVTAALLCVGTARADGFEEDLPWFGGDGGDLHLGAQGGLITELHLQAGQWVDQLGYGGDGWRWGPVGGSGGVSRYARCPADSYAVGVEGRAGQYIDQIGLICRTGAGQLVYSARYGGDGGYSFTSICDGYLAGIDVRAGGFVDAVRPRCGWFPDG